jgi:hypothetical protein
MDGSNGGDGWTEALSSDLDHCMVLNCTIRVFSYESYHDTPSDLARSFRNL